MKEKIQLNTSLSKVKSQSHLSNEESVVSISLKASDDCDTTAPLQYMLTEDNIDKNVDMTLEHQTKSLHYFHAYAALSRIDFTGLSEETPTSHLFRSLDTAAFLPFIADCQVLRENYVVRVICDTDIIFFIQGVCPKTHFFTQIFSEYVNKICYSKQLKNFTATVNQFFVQVPLVVILKNENVREMLEILTTLHEYVPKNKVTGMYFVLLVANDQE